MHLEREGIFMEDAATYVLPSIRNKKQHLNIQILYVSSSKLCIFCMRKFSTKLLHKFECFAVDFIYQR